MERSQFFLFVGDVHLGRRPGRVPADLLTEGLDPRSLSPRAAFEAVIEEVLTLGVRAVVFLGDVVDAEEHFLEAYSILERGVRRLVEAGIEVLAVAGNHDVRALPRLVDEVPGFRLLGAGGRWEEHVLTGPDGEPLVRLVGWSFPRPKVTVSPLSELGELALGPRADIPTIGLLHCDLDQRSSPYVPVLRRDLEAVMVVDAWLLGHVHAPSYEALAPQRPVGYLGSLVGLDPSETGVHGPWRLALDGGRAFQLEQLPLAPFAWTAIDVPVEEVNDTDGIKPALTAALRDFAEGGGGRFVSARAVGCKLRLVGRSPISRPSRGSRRVSGGASRRPRGRAPRREPTSSPLGRAPCSPGRDWATGGRPRERWCAAGQVHGWRSLLRPNVASASPWSSHSIRQAPTNAAAQEGSDSGTNSTANRLGVGSQGRQ